MSGAMLKKSYLLKKTVANIKNMYINSTVVRDIAQPGRALASGARGHGFESRYPDQYKKIKTDTEKCPLFLYPLKAQF